MVASLLLPLLIQIRERTHKLNVRQLEAFRATMRSGSITGAADILHVSQPSVSRLISDLEHCVGFSLFERAGRGITPTAEARRFHEAVESIFVGLDRLSDIADTIRSSAGSTISAGVIQAFSHVVVPEALRKFSELHLDVNIMVSIKNTQEIIDGVQTHQYDIGIVSQSPPYNGVETLFHTTVPYVCLVPETHWTTNVIGDLDLLTLVETETFVSFGGIYPNEMLDIDKELAVKLSNCSKIFAANTPLLGSLARTTGAFAIVDPFTASIEEKLGGVVIRTIKQNLKYHVAMIGMRPGVMPRGARNMVEIIISQLEQH